MTKKYAIYWTASQGDTWHLFSEFNIPLGGEEDIIRAYLDAFHKSENRPKKYLACRTLLIQEGSAPAEIRKTDNELSEIKTVMGLKQRSMNKRRKNYQRNDAFPLSENRGLEETE